MQWSLKPVLAGPFMVMMVLMVAGTVMRMMMVMCVSA